MLVRRLRRTSVVLVLCSLFAVAFAAIAARIDVPGPAVAWSLYVVGDMFNTVMLTMFWAMTNDLVRADQARRLYGLVGLGGVLGGLVGSTVVRQAIEPLGRPALMRELTRIGMQSRTLMEWVLRIMANLLREDELGPAEAAYRMVAALARQVPEPVATSA